jgi:FdhD protein
VRVRVREYAAPGHQDAAAAFPRSREDRLATEEPLEVRATWPGQPAQRVAVTMRTPGHDFELAAGLLYAEGVLDPAALHSVAYCTDEELTAEEEFNVVTVRMATTPRRLPSPRPGTVTATSSACGVCGTESIDDVLSMRGPADRTAPPASVSPAMLHALPARLREAQRVFDSTGGLHAAGWFDHDGRLVVLREDIGRHNAVDKVVGSRLLAGESTAAPVLCVSGRIGFEIVQKAVAAGVGMVAAIGAPSSLAVRLAQEAGLGLVGFLSERRFVVYTAPDCIAG